MTSHDPAALSVVGLFDSGVGGLSVLREVRALMPAARTVYVGDSAHVPYGSKSVEFIQNRSRRISTFLVTRGARVLVVACNSATAAAVSLLRTEFSLPVIGMEPGVKVAIGHSRSGVIGVLATPATLASQKFAALLREHGGAAQIVVQPCHGWVERVESGDVHSLHVRAMIQRDLAPLMERGADTLVLGCTHFPFLADQIRAVAGANVTLVDTGAPVAREVKRRLLAIAANADDAAAPGDEEFWTSGDPARATELYSVLLQRRVTVKQLPDNNTE